ncbi:MAG: TonB-dependent receptor [Steroidobacteraceae bacterium]|jgi:outer membrane receptor protein involved in Fe transport
MNNYRMARAVALCLSLSGGMFAQIAAAQQARSDSGQLEEIIVTAEKRESTVQTTPISLTAVSGQDIQDRGLTDLGNLVQSVPGVSIRSSGPGMTEFEMRGVASTGGNSPTVGFYYDDTSLTAPSAANEGKIVISPSLYDLNRVEVLRGPQGTLYGSGSMGGTIKVVPNAPNPDAFDASAELVFGDTDHGGFDHAENAMVNLPFGAGLAALRLVGSYSRDAGWIDRVVIAPGEFPLPNGTTRGDVLAAPVVADYHDVNDVEKTSIRVSAVVNPVEGLSITPSFFYQKLSSGGLPYIDSNPGTDAHYQPYDISEAYSDTFKLSSINITYKTPILALTSITSYWSRNEPVTQDATESWTTGLGPYVNGYYPPTGLGASSAIEYNPTHQTTEEFRISSVGDSSLKWLVGYYYEDFHSAWDIVFPSQNGAALFGSNNLFSYFSPMPIYQQSVFGEVTYNVTEPWAITLGARRYRYDAPVSLDQFGSLTATVVTETSERDQGVTPKVSTSYEFTKDLMVYLTAAKGFRPGGGTGPVPTSGPSTVNCEPQLQVEYGSNGAFVSGPDSFKSDNIWSYEAGEKWTLFDKRVTVNGALYFEKWSGVQQTNALSKCGYVYTANAGDAHVRGGELEIQAIVVPEVTVSGNVGYSHAALVSSTLIDAGFNPGTAIQDVPQWTSTVSAAWRHSLTDQLALSARLDNTYTGSRTDETYSINQLPSYDLTNIRAGVDAGHWNAVLFVNNVADKRALISNITQAAENIPTFNRVAVSQPRTVGIDLNYRFGGH